jgi:PAS domain S-box-containing protein
MDTARLHLRPFAGDDAWEVLAASGLRLVHVASVGEAVRALTDQAAQVVIADAHQGPALIRVVRGRRDLAAAHVVICAAVESADELRAALDAGADDVMRIPFEPEVLAARVAAGLRAARLRANEALLRSLVANIPGAVYRCACDENWTMQWLSDEIEEISGYKATDFIESAVRTFASVIHPEDREQVERSVMDAVAVDRPFTIEYRILRRDGDVRWVLERGQAQDAGDGRRWLDGAISDVTARRAAGGSRRRTRRASNRPGRTAGPGARTASGRPD